MNIQAQPGLPPFPLIRSMAAASKPEKVFDSDPATKKIVILGRTLDNTPDR